MWALRGTRPVVPSAGQNRRVSVFGALDLSGELSCMITERKRSSEFREFLQWLNDVVYVDSEHIFLFMDNCSIHKTKAVQAYFENNKKRITVIWNAPYAPNLNDIERSWGALKRSSVNNYYFETKENLEDAVITAIDEHNRMVDRKRNGRSMFYSLRRPA